MGHYDDCYYEANKERFEREAKARNCRQRLVDELSHDDMIKIMFTDFIKKKDDYDSIKLAEEYLSEESPL